MKKPKVNQNLLGRIIRFLAKTGGRSAKGVWILTGGQATLKEVELCLNYLKKLGRVECRRPMYPLNPFKRDIVMEWFIIGRR